MRLQSFTANLFYQRRMDMGCSSVPPIWILQWFGMAIMRSFTSHAKCAFLQFQTLQSFYPHHLRPWEQLETSYGYVFVVRTMFGDDWLSRSRYPCFNLLFWAAQACRHTTILSDFPHSFICPNYLIWPMSPIFSRFSPPCDSFYDGYGLLYFHLWRYWPTWSTVTAYSTPILYICSYLPTFFYPGGGSVAYTRLSIRHIQ